MCARARAYEQYYESNFSQVISSFGGQLVSVLECKTCGHTSNCFDPFLDLSLPIPEQSQVKEGEGQGDAAGGVGCRHKVDLHECLDAFCAPETLTGDDMYCCDTCACRREASKQLW